MLLKHRQVPVIVKHDKGLRGVRIVGTVSVVQWLLAVQKDLLRYEMSLLVATGCSRRLAEV